MGIDLHKRYFASTIMDKEGKAQKRSRVFPTIPMWLALERGFLKWQSKYYFQNQHNNLTLSKKVIKNIQ